ncbi:MAG: hypothetical protein ACRD1T_21585, partial [Acidimicrobiia bacterium]
MADPDPTSPDAWKRLGEALSTRRPQLNPKHRNRQAFTKDKGLEYRVVYDIEKGARTNFRPETIAGLEAAYGLPAGSFARFREDPTLTEFSAPGTPPLTVHI